MFPDGIDLFNGRTAGEQRAGHRLLLDEVDPRDGGRKQGRAAARREREQEIISEIRRVCGITAISGPVAEAQIEVDEVAPDVEAEVLTEDELAVASET